MRILVLSWKDLSHPRAGGAEVFTDKMCARWAALGHDVTWFAAAVPGRSSREVKNGITLIRAGGRLGVYRAARRYFLALPPGAFDLVIDEINTRPFLAPRWVGATPCVALIFQLCREIWWHETPWPVALAGRFYMERHWLRTYRRSPVLTLSESSRESLEPYGLSGARVIPAGIDGMTRPDVERERALTMIFVGRLASNKRPADAVRAFESVRKVLPEAQLWMVGDGPERAALQRVAGAGVTFFGRTSDDEKKALMARAHVLLVTSVREGWGLVVDEAAAMGTPAIGYDVAGLRDSIPAAGGILTDPSPGALADAIVQRAEGLVGASAGAGWRGGALPWDEAADAVLQACVEALSERAGQLRTATATRADEQPQEEKGAE